MGRVLLFGGTFNPVHKGHTNAVQIMNERLLFDKIIVMPSKIPPHKIAPDLASESHRFAMCKLAFSDFKTAEISDFEISREEISYSYYTVKYLNETYPDDEIFMAVGSDMLLSFDRWYRFDDILKMCALVCVSREKGDFDKLILKKNQLERYGKIILVEAEPFEISSTEIRDKIKNNEDTSCYLEKSVVKYIRENKIYCG